MADRLAFVDGVSLLDLTTLSHLLFAVQSPVVPTVPATLTTAVRGASAGLSGVAGAAQVVSTVRGLT